MFGFGMPELIIVLIIVIMVAGPTKLPALGKALGGSIRGFRKELKGGDALEIDGK